MAGPLYVGVFLTPESREKLLSFVPPVHKEIIADHMTILFSPDSLFVGNLALGKTVKLKIHAHAHNDKVQAAVVSGVLSNNDHSHITISIDREKGGRPKDSNTMLEDAFAQETVHLVSKEMLLEGVIDTFPRSKTEEQGDTKNG